MSWVWDKATGALDDVWDFIDDEILDPILDVGSWVNDKIFKPIIKSVEAQIQSFIDNPIETIAKIAIMAAPLPAPMKLKLYAMVDATSALANGEGIDGALKAYAISYASGQIAEGVSDYAGTYAWEELGAAGVSDGTRRLVTSAITEGTRAATTAAIYDEDPIDAFITGGVTQFVRAGLGKVGEQLEGQGISLESLPDTVINALASGLESSLAQIIVNGEIDELKLARAITAQVITAESVNNLLEDIGFEDLIPTTVDDPNTSIDESTLPNLRSRTLTAITGTIQNTVSAALSGGSGSEAFGQSIAAYTANAIKGSLTEGGFQGLLDDASELFDRVSGNYTDVRLAAEAIDKNVLANAEAVGEYNELVTTIGEEATELKRLDDARIAAEQALSKIVGDPFDPNNLTRLGLSEGEQTALIGDLSIASAEAKNAYDAALTTFRDDVENVYNPRLVELNDTINETITAVGQPARTVTEYTQFGPVDRQQPATGLYKEYADSLGTLVSGTEALDKELQPLYNNINEGVVSELNPNFNAEFYAEHNNLPEGTDAYEHYLNMGLQQKLYTNSTEYNQALTNTKNTALLTTIAAAGLNPALLSGENVKVIAKKLAGEFGDNIDALKEFIANPNSDVMTNFLGLLNSALAESASIPTTVNEATNDLLEAAGLPTQELGTELSDESKQVLVTNNINSNDPSEEIARAEGVTDMDIANGTAKLIPNPNTGLLQWDNIELTGVVEWDSERDKFVQVRTIGGFRNVYDLDGNELESVILVTRFNDGFGWLKENSPELYLAQLAALEEEAARATGESSWWIDQAKDALDRREEAGSGITGLANFYRATEGVLSAFNGVVIAMGIDPNSTPFGKGLNELGELADSYLPEDYVAAQEAMSKKIGDAVGAAATAEAIFGAFVDHPTEFLAEYIGVEAMQELVPLLVGGFASVGIKGAAGLLKYADEAASLMAQRGGMSAALASDMAEAYGGTASGTYEEALAVALQSGMPEAEAEVYALNLAQKAGVTAMSLAALSAGAGGLSLEKAFLTDKATGSLNNVFEEIGERFSRGATITLKEGITEGIEEGITSVVTESALYQLDPTRDITGNVTAAAMFGVIAGGGIAGGTSLAVDTGDFLSNFIGNYNPQINNLLTSGSTDQAAVSAQLQELGVTDPLVTSNLMDIAFDEANISSAEASQAFADAGYTPSQEEIDNFVLSNFGDADLENTSGTEFYNYLDPRQITQAELDAYTQNTGITLTQNQIDALLGNHSDAQDNNDRIQNYLDDNLDSEDTDDNDIPDSEDTDGVAPLDTDGDGIPNSEDTDDDGDGVLDVDDFSSLDPNIQTDPSAGDPLDLLDTDGDGIPDSEDTDDDGDGVLDVDDFNSLDPNIQTDPNAVAPLDTDGDGIPDSEDTDDDGDGVLDVDDFNSLDSNIQTDPNAVAAGSTTSSTTGVDDATQALIDAAVAEATAGLINPTDTDGDGIPDALQAQIDALFEGYVSPDDIQGLIDASIASQGLVSPDSIPQTGLTQDQLTTALELALGDVSTLTRQEVQDIADDLLKNIPAGATPAQVATAVTEALGNYNVSTLTQDQVENLLIKQLDTQTTDILEGTAGQLGTQTTDITDVTGTQIGASTDAILTRANQIESAGIARDQALNRAIGDVSTQLGTTRTELLNRIGETEQTLLTRLGEVESTLSQGQQQISEEVQLVAEYVGKPATEVTQADIDFVADYLIAQDAQTVPTDQQLQYDVNNDGVVDINDQAMLEQSLGGQDITLQGQFAPTGLYAQEAQTQQDIQTAQDLATQQNLQLQQQIDNNRKRGNTADLFQQIIGSEDVFGQTVTVDESPLTELKYQYDIGGDSIFANQQQAALFSNPYGKAAAQGGLIDRNEDLLRLIGED